MKSIAEFLEEGERIHARRMTPAPAPMTKAQALAVLDGIMGRLDPEDAATLATVRAYIAGPK